MTEISKLQTIKLICPHCGDKQLRTAQWLTEQQVIECRCGNSTDSSNLEQLIYRAVEELK